MKILKRFIKVLLQTFYALSKINWLSFFKYYKSNTTNVVWVDSFNITTFGIETFCWELGYIQAFINRKEYFCICRRIKSFNSKKIFWSPSSRLVNNAIDYPKQLHQLATQSEKLNNQLFPSAYDVRFLENKVFMYEYFHDNKINTPQTWIFDTIESLSAANLNCLFPLLLKGSHSSGSKDIFKFADFDSLVAFLKKSDFLAIHSKIILQELLNIRKDLRVTIIGDKIVLHYWRINNSDEWKPTSTSKGNSVDFVSFPEHWRTHILDSFNKTGLKMGAFDVTWNNDDLSTTPLYLEISPRFSPNPPITDSKYKSEYGKWKKEIFIKNPYYRLQTNIIFEFSNEYVDACFQNS